MEKNRNITEVIHVYERKNSSGSSWAMVPTPNIKLFLKMSYTFDPPKNSIFSI